MKAAALIMAAWLGLATAASASSDPAPVISLTHHSAVIGGQALRYDAVVESFPIPDGSGTTGADLVATTYLRQDVAGGSRRPVVFIFNGGPTVATIGLHMELGPRHQEKDEDGAGKAEFRFADNPDSLLDAADLVIFDPAETGFSRVRPNGHRSYFYSTAGDAASLADLVQLWTVRHHREASPRYLLGESYGSIREVVASDVLAGRGLPVSGDIIFGDSIFLQETSRRTHNIVSTAVSLPLLAMTAAYHGKADRHGETPAAYLDEVYAFSVGDYLSALGRGRDLPVAERSRIARRLAGYTGVPAEYFLTHNLTVAKQDFNRMLLPGQVLNQDDTRQASPAGSPRRALSTPGLYDAYFRDELNVHGMGEYRDEAPDSFDLWNWGNGCDAYLRSAGLCSNLTGAPSVFEDYDWPEVLKAQFERPDFRVMVVAGYYDGLSSIGTHRYLQSQLDYPRGRFELHEYPAGHATAADDTVRPQLSRDLHRFLLGGGAQTTAP